MMLGPRIEPEPYMTRQRKLHVVNQTRQSKSRRPLCIYISLCLNFDEIYARLLDD
jgi:hypothetical protein